MKVLVTGATGLVGSHLAEQLAGQGHAVKALVRTTSDISFLRTLDVEIIQGNMLDAPSLLQATRGEEVVFHCAALMPVNGTSEELYLTNVNGTENLLRACVANGVRRLVYVSSIAVYGYRSLLGADEDTTLVPNGWYSASKVESERRIRACYQEHGLEFVILRPCAIYGVRDSLFLPNLLSFRWWRPVPLLDGGQYIIDFVDAAKVAEALVSAATRPEAGGRVYNVTDGERVTFRRFVEILGELWGRPLPTLSLPSRLACRGIAAVASVGGGLGIRSLQLLTAESVRAISAHQHFDISRAREELDYKPPADFREGLQRAMNWFEGTSRSRFGWAGDGRS